MLCYVVIKSGINNVRLHLLGPFYSRLSIFLSSLTKSLRLFPRDLVRKENLILNISMKDVHDFVEDSLTLIFFVCFTLTHSVYVALSNDC